MSLKSSSIGESLPFSRVEERPPLRSLDNEIIPPSTPSRLKIRTSLNAESAKNLNDDIPDRESELHLHPRSPITTVEATPITDRSTSQPLSDLGDVTFKSYICAGGEVEILSSVLCADESIVLPEDAVSFNNEKEDTTITLSGMISCCEHEEHPYCSSERNESHFVITNTPDESNFASNALGQDDLVDEQNSTAVHTSKDIIWQSMLWDGGEVEVHNDLIQEDEQIPPLESQFSKSLNTSSVNSSYSDGLVNSPQIEHADHPYCTRKSVSAAIVERTYSSETSIPDIMFKSFTCTGGEADTSDTPNFAQECVLTGQQNLSTTETESFDQPYCHRTPAMHQDNISSIASKIPTCSASTVDDKMVAMEEPDNVDDQKHGSLFDSVIPDSDEAQQSGVSPAKEKQVVVNQTGIESGSNSTAQSQSQDLNDQAECCADRPDMMDPEQDSLCSCSETNTSKNTSDQHIHNSDVQDRIILLEDGEIPSLVFGVDVLENDQASVKGFTPEEIPQHVEKISEDKYISSPSDSSEAKECNPDSSGNGLAGLSVENAPLFLKVHSDYSSIVSALQLGVQSPVNRKASQCSFRNSNHPAQGQFLADDSALEGEKSFLSPIFTDPALLLAEVLESPMPRPLLNSTAVAGKPKAGPITGLIEEFGEKVNVVSQPDFKEQVLDFPLMSEGPLQQQLRQMAEFLILASGKMGPAAAHPVTTSPPVFKTASVESHTASVGTSPVKLVDHSLNTSGLYEPKRVFSVMDSCTDTDPLLWNLPPGSLDGLSKQELEQRLMSSMIMVEALVQQLAAARAQGCSSAGCAPSELREKLVQTDHTELSQTSLHRDLYMAALSRISELELNEHFLQNLMQRVQDTRTAMMSLSSDTNASLSTTRELCDTVAEDHQSLVHHYGHMKSLFEKSKRTQLKMTEKVKEALQQRSDMETQMQEAITAKESAFNVMEQLRIHCARDISACERSLGSQQELLTALKQTYPQQASLNKTYNETLSSALELLSQTVNEQSTLKEELCTVQSLLQRCVPILLKLNEKAADALRERDEHMSAKDQAVEERERIEEELNEGYSNLQSARDQIGDLNLQVTILSSEMGVLRQKLMEKEEETGQLERKVTEMSATVSSTLASYAFLEQALAGETTKLQETRKDAKEARERADGLALSLDQSEQHREQLHRALTQSEEQLRQLQTLTESQTLQIQQLQDVCTQLSSVREMNEFLLMENQLAREQVGESEQMLGENLQGLRERNIQCEDLKREVHQLQMENKGLQAELENMKCQSDSSRLQLEERMALAATDITLVLHTLRGLTNELHSAITHPETSQTSKEKDKESQPVNNTEPLHSSSSFVLLALTAEREEDVRTETTAESVTPDKEVSPCEPLFSQTGAFTRLEAFTPKKSGTEAEVDPEVEDQSRVAELLSDLSSTVTELVNALKVVRQRKDGRLEEQQKTICDLQMELQASNSMHEAKTSELEHQLSRLKNLVERGNRALEQKVQDEKTLAKLVTDVEQSQEALNKHKADNNELRKELSELRRSLQQSKMESQFLREELKKGDGRSATPAHYFEEKIHLLKEVERLKACLQEAEQARVKLLERAKRHQIIHQTNQQKSENELQMLNNMINKIRETLLSLPEVVNSCKQLQQLAEYIG